MTSQPLRANAKIAFSRVDDFLDDILASIASHDMTVSREGTSFSISAPFGTARLVPAHDELQLSVEANEYSALNHLKHALAGPITFIARSENLDIVWDGDRTGPVLPSDLRVLRVAHIDDLTPRTRRITFTGENLERYAADDQIHCRLLFQPHGNTAPQWPLLNDDGKIVWPKSGQIPTRVYTIRRIDAAAGEIEIEFTLHQAAGPARRWAQAARVGDQVGILGPAAYGPKPASWYVLAGDETGLPGIARILAGLPRAARGIAFIEIDHPDEEQNLIKPEELILHWLHRDGAAPGTTTLLRDAIRTCEWPDDLATAFFWGGFEYQTFKDIHHFLRQEIGLPAGRRILHSHWRRGMSEEDIVAVGGDAISP